MGVRSPLHAIRRAPAQVRAPVVAPVALQAGGQPARRSRSRRLFEIGSTAAVSGLPTQNILKNLEKRSALLHCRELSVTFGYHYQTTINMSVLDSLSPVSLSSCLAFLDIPSRFECRLVCKHFTRNTPSPFRMAADILELTNNFDVCTYDNIKNSGGQRCRSGSCREHNDWLWQGNENEAAMDASGDFQFFRSDPRRTPAYYALSKRVALNCSHLLCNDWASKSHNSDEKQRYIAMLRFCKASARRLSDYYFPMIQEITEGGDGRWGSPGVVSDYQSAEEQETQQKLVTLHESSPCRYQVLHELANLKIAADELKCDYGQVRSGYYQPIYWFLRDHTAIGGVVHVDSSEGSSLWQQRDDYVKSHLDPGSDNHLEKLLTDDNLMLKSTFGASFYDCHLSVLAPIRAVWPEILAKMNAIDAASGSDSGSDFEK